MTAGQTRVLVIVLAVLGLEAIWSPNMRQVLTGHVPNVPGAAGALVADAIALLLLIALAAIAPNMATMFAVLLLVAVLLAHAGPLAGVVNGVTQVNKNLAHAGE